MKRLVKYLLSLILALLTNAALAQDAEMADSMRADGKIYVVVAIILMVLAGFFLYLFLLDKKVSRIEKKLHDNKLN
jgi:hypothetical protein